MTSDPLIEPSALGDLLAGDRAVSLLDVRWALTGPTGITAYLAGHIDGAVYVDLDTELAAPVGPGTGRHPLPSIEDLQRAARSWGLRTGQPVVVYDDSSGLSAARAWWLLRWAGVTDVRVLDGGLAGWIDNGGAVTTGPVDVAPGDVDVRGGQLPVLTADHAAELATDGTLLDARAAERYRGESEPIDPVAGHIPGARNAPTTENLAANGRFQDAGVLTERFARLDVDGLSPVGVYCGSGVTAAHEILALARIGVPAALYPGSWSEWITDPNRPVATGPETGRASKGQRREEGDRRNRS
jgi:thiosulfate/3-mercaptopyruvate sulfurtransferase